uniref:Transmembrane protein n=1 Tax=Geobacter metallireducens TaxID=28232 RepID=A0A831U0X2_GEOME
MNRSLKIVLLVLGVAVLWGVLAAINAGLIGLGVLLSVLALLEIATGEFRGNNRLVWLIIVLAALLFAFIGMGSVLAKSPEAPEGNPLYVLSAVISLLLPVTYFVVGRRQRVMPTK